MSSTGILNPADYKKGEDRYVRFAEDILGLRMSLVQKEILKSVTQHQRVLVWGGNGPGKSYVVAILKLAFLYSNPYSIVLGTSGSYQQYQDTMWRPLQNMHSKAQKRHGLPGRTLGGNQPSLEIEPQWFAKVVSPRDPGELEGRHADHVLIVIDEADKKYLGREHFDSAGSSITDINDRMVAICNPPKDENNVVYRKKEDPRWHTIEVSAFDSHNAMVDAGVTNEPRIPGLTDLLTIADDWENWNGRDWPLAQENYPGDWPGMPKIMSSIDSGALDRDTALQWIAPGYNVAKEAHERWDHLDERWYIRRAGVIPPSGAEAHRPIEPVDVKEAWARPAPSDITVTPRSVGIDVARSSDKTVMIGEHNGLLKVHYEETGDNHEKQKRDVVEGTDTTKGLKEWGNPKVAVDRGYAPGFYDYVSDRVPNVVGFQNGTKPVEATRWYDKWSEALYHFGQWLEEGGVIENESLREQALVAARVVTFSDRTLQSRGRNGAEVYESTPKEDIKEELGHSPDHLDAALMAVWRLRTQTMSKQTRSTWYDPYTVV